MEKTILSPEEFLPRFVTSDEPKTRAARTVGRTPLGEWALRRVLPEASAFEREESFWLLDGKECKELLIEALRRGRVTMAEYNTLQEELRAPESSAKTEPVKPAPQKPGEVCIFRGDGAEIGLLKDTRPYLRLDGEEYTLSSHPFDLCTYIRKNSRVVITIRNAFEIYTAYEMLADGKTLTSISGRKYDAAGFCSLLACAVRMGLEELQLSDAEALLPREEIGDDDPVLENEKHVF